MNKNSFDELLEYCDEHDGDVPPRALIDINNTPKDRKDRKYRYVDNKVYTIIYKSNGSFSVVKGVV